MGDGGWGICWFSSVPVTCRVQLDSIRLESEASERV